MTYLNIGDWVELADGRQGIVMGWRVTVDTSYVSLRIDQDVPQDIPVDDVRRKIGMNTRPCTTPDKLTS